MTCRHSETLGYTVVGKKKNVAYSALLSVPISLINFNVLIYLFILSFTFKYTKFEAQLGNDSTVN